MDEDDDFGNVDEHYGEEEDPGRQDSAGQSAVKNANAISRGQNSFMINKSQAGTSQVSNNQRLSSKHDDFLERQRKLIEDAKKQYQVPLGQASQSQAAFDSSN